MISNFGEKINIKQGRLLWPDAAKGICIFLVVLLHITSKHYIALDWDLPPALLIVWQGLALVFGPIRMPLFFAISGYFVAKYLAKRWGEVARPRIAATYYLYLVWFLLHTLYFSTNLSLSMHKPDTIGQFLLGLVLGYTSLWYLYALPAYFILTKLFASRPTATLTVAGIISVLSGTNLLPSIGNTDSLLGNFVFFAAAAYLPGRVEQQSEIPSFRRTWIPLMGFLIMSTAVAAVTHIVRVAPLGIDLILSLGGLMTSVVGLIAGIRLFAWLSVAAPSLMKPWATIGRETLPIYVLHLPLMAIMHVVMAGADLPVAILAVYPLVASVVLIAACLVLYRLLLFSRTGWLFTLPSRPDQIPLISVESSSHTPTARRN